MGEVATVRTVLTPAQALGAVRAALPLGASMTAIVLIAAQSAVETAGWQSMHNWNMGNVTPTPTQAVTGDWMNQGLPMRYISYGSATAGAKGMVGWLSQHGLLASAEAGDLDGYMAGLLAGCYLGCPGNTDPTGHTVTQDDYDNYRAGIASWMNKLSGVQPAAPPGGALATTGKVLVVAALGAAAYAGRGRLLALWRRVVA